ncbi:MAG: DUF2288 family protein [Gammaproteobacteria bacterium]|nr:DUF2288 family protein [Gammaproteobacteria bacterium]
MKEESIVNQTLRHEDLTTETTVGVFDVKEQLNLETARIQWSELERHFARGVIIVVCQGTDLIKVAGSFVEDDVETVQLLTALGKIRHADMEDAKRWQPGDVSLWAVVAAPWVLVQQSES